MVTQVKAHKHRIDTLVIANITNEQYSQYG